MNISYLSRVRGSFLGLAIGDSAGAPLEFRERGTFQPLTDFDGADFWTDDTSMTLAVALSLIEKRKSDLRHQAELFANWYHGEDDRLGATVHHIGTVTRLAIKRFIETGDPYSGADDEQSAGNGSLMRIAPIPLFFANDLDQAVEAAVASSRITHQEERCLQSCAYLSALIWGAMNGYPKEKLLSPLFPSREYWSSIHLHPEVKDVMQGNFDSSEPASSGYVVDTLKAALWAFRETDSFGAGLLKSVNLGADADTVGAIYGSLAGSYYGEEGIPSHWKANLAKGEFIAEIANKLWQSSLGPAVFSY